MKAYCPNCGKIDSTFVVKREVDEATAETFHVCPTCGHEVYLKTETRTVRRDVDLGDEQTVKRLIDHALND